MVTKELGGSGYVACVKRGYYLRHDDGALKHYVNPQAARSAALAATREAGGREVPIAHLTAYDMSSGMRDANDEYARRWP